MKFFAADMGDSAPSAGSDAAATPGGEPAAPAAADANTPAAEPSAAAEPAAKPEPSLLDATTAAVQADMGAASAPAKPDANAPVVAEPNAPDPHKVLSVEEQAAADKLLPFHDHPRFKQITGENRSFKAKIAELTPGAQTMNDLRTFLAENDIPAKEFDNAMQILAYLRTDPLKAQELLAEISTNLDKFSGKVLPPDLQTKVDAGELTAEDAGEMARLRNQQAHQQQQGQRNTQKTEQQKAEDQKRELQRAIYDAGATWETQKRTSDPDYAKNEVRVQRAARALMQERGNPTNSAEAVAILEEAYKIVNDDLAEFAPHRQPVKPTPSGASVSSAVKQPTTMAEAIAQAAQQT